MTFLAQLAAAGGVLAVVAAVDLVVGARRRAAAPPAARVGEPVWEPAWPADDVRAPQGPAGSSATPW